MQKIVRSSQRVLAGAMLMRGWAAFQAKRDRTAAPCEAAALEDIQAVDAISTPVVLS